MEVGTNRLVTAESVQEAKRRVRRNGAASQMARETDLAFCLVSLESEARLDSSRLESCLASPPLARHD